MCITQVCKLCLPPASQPCPSCWNSQCVWRSVPDPVHHLHLHPWTLRIKTPLAPRAPSLPCSLQWGYESSRVLVRFFCNSFSCYSLHFSFLSFGKIEMQMFRINKIILFYSKQVNQAVIATRHVSVAHIVFSNERDKYSWLRMALHPAWKNGKQNSYRDKGKKEHLCSLDHQWSIPDYSIHCNTNEEPKGQTKGSLPKILSRKGL